MMQPNLNYINELAGNDEKFKQKVIEILKSELPLEIEEYEKCLENNNTNAIADVVHKLKHKVSVLGLEDCYYIVENFENNLKKGSTNLQNEFEEILSAMQIFVKDL